MHLRGSRKEDPAWLLPARAGSLGLPTGPPDHARTIPLSLGGDWRARRPRMCARRARGVRRRPDLALLGPDRRLGTAVSALVGGSHRHGCGDAGNLTESLGIYEALVQVRS